MTPTIDSALVQQARTLSANHQIGVPAALAQLLDCMPRTLQHSLGQFFDMPVYETADLLECEAVLELLPLHLAMARHCVLVRSAGRLRGIVTDPFDTDTLTWLQHRAGASNQRPLELGLTLPADLQAYLSKHEASARAVDGLTDLTKTDQDSSRAAVAVLSFASASESTSPAVKLINSTLYDAIRSGASDIHLESTATGLAVKYRVDGVLDHVTTVSGNELAEQAISRLKVLAELDISERRIPQDGSFRVSMDSRDIDLRVSVMPSIHGEDAVIRILDKRAMIEAYGALTLEALGFEAESLITLRALAQEAHGMLLVTGPTGSGKTTTLYATLTEIHNGREKIITIEDPVEYQLPGILQIPVNEKKGLSFAKGLRSILRHDPDKIMVGEIRDRETAEIAVQSALTGHLVLTTVHANNVFDVFGRFSHMGIDPYAFVSALNGIWAQRLIRLNCQHCAVDYLPSLDELAAVGLEHRSPGQWRRGCGCGDCRGTGYRGRKSIAEILRLNDALRELIVEKRPIRQIKAAAYSNGTRSLRQVALALAQAGQTTLDEVRRVTTHA